MTDFNQATFMYKYKKNLLPSSFYDTFKKLGNFERPFSTFNRIRLSMYKNLQSSIFIFCNNKRVYLGQTKNCSFYVDPVNYVKKHHNLLRFFGFFFLITIRFFVKCFPEPLDQFISKSIFCFCCASDGLDQIGIGNSWYIIPISITYL